MKKSPPEEDGRQRTGNAPEKIVKEYLSSGDYSGIFKKPVRDNSGEFIRCVNVGVLCRE